MVFDRRSTVPGPAQRKRLPLGANRRRLSFDLRLRLVLFVLALPSLCCAAWLAWQQSDSPALALGAFVLGALLYALIAASLFEQFTRPLQTLANVVAALREDDFSFRARGARRGDSLGDLALEINALAGTLQAQRGTARDALTLAERVMDAMRTPVLAFTAEGTLRSINPAAARSFGLQRAWALGQPAAALGLAPLLALADSTVLSHAAPGGAATDTRWAVQRSSFRLAGLPHTLFVLSDVDLALREEERLAWQRLVRVLSHEINNSLTPITSLAGSLRDRLPSSGKTETTEAATRNLEDLRRGLHLIEERAVSLHRFLQSYQQLARLPSPALQPVSLPALVQRIAALQPRWPLHLVGGPEVILPLDVAQVERLLINLLQNAVEAAQSVTDAHHVPHVELAWTVQNGEAVLSITDNGPGLLDTANLFVPFFTTKPNGSGIGLALAKQIAEAHGGVLTLQNRRSNAGCLAEVRFPA